jgi:nucleoid-associated protein EbfC
VFKGLGNLASLVRHAQEIGGRMGGLADELKVQRVTGAAGGGLVEVEANGLAEILGCRIDPKLFEQNDRELVEDLVIAAVNQALAKAKQLHAEAVKGLTGGIELPGLQDALSKMTGNAGPGDQP